MRTTLLVALVVAAAIPASPQEWDQNNNRETTVVTDAGWEIRMTEHWMHGVTALIAQASQESPIAGMMHMDIVCEKDDPSPRVHMALVSERLASVSTENHIDVRFDAGGARGQPSEEAIDITHGSRLATLSNDLDKPGFGPTAFVQGIEAADSVLVSVPVGNRREAIYEFDVSDPELTRAVGEMAGICQMQTKAEIGRSQQTLDEQGRTPQYRTPPSPSGGIVEATPFDDARQECNKGLFSREAARWTGRGVGAAVGAMAHEDDRSLGALIGAVIGDRKLQERRERLGVVRS